MARVAVSVRPIGYDDFPTLLEMWGELREQGSRVEKVGPAPTSQEVVDRLRDITADPTSRALLALVGNQPVGMTILRAAPATPLCDQLSVHVHYLYVREPWRRRGAGSALLTAAAAFAEEVGAEHCSVSVPPQLRDTNRFLARLGFAPVAVRRAVPESVLRRRLAPIRPNGSADSVVARRRSMRRLRGAVHVSELAARVTN